MAAFLPDLTSAVLVFAFSDDLSAVAAFSALAVCSVLALATFASASLTAEAFLPAVSIFSYLEASTRILSLGSDADADGFFGFFRCRFVFRRRFFFGF